MSDQKKWRIAVMASGHGSNLQAIMDACKAGDINGEVVVVASNKKGSYALVRAREAKIDALAFEAEKFQTRTVMCAKIAKSFHDYDVDLVCLAGYMLKVEPCLIRSFPNRILNIHPALLPKYGGKGMFGRHVHEAVLAAKEKETGCTVHLVDEIFDNGPIIDQKTISVKEGDTPETLAERLHPKEHELYVSVLKRVCSGKLDLDKITAKKVTT